MKKERRRGCDAMVPMELPAGFEPTVSELQSLALPLGYGSGEGIITPGRGKIKGGIDAFPFFYPTTTERLTSW